jgi:hypothetical protein
MRARWLCLLILCLLITTSSTPTVFAQTEIVIGSTHSGILTTEAPRALFAFTGEAEQHVVIELTSLDDLLRLQAAVFDENGQLVLIMSNLNSDPMLSANLTLPRAGTYTLQVMSSNDQTGEFTVRLAGSAAAHCGQVIQEVIARLDDVCTEIGSNQVCYGHLNVHAQPIAALPENVTFQFEQVGDIAELAHLHWLALSPLDHEAGTWGVALMRLEALPDQYVSLLFFGDVQVMNTALIDPQLAAHYLPMQSFYFQRGSQAAMCQDMPDSGVFIFLPEEAEGLEFHVNMVTLELASSAFLSLSDEQTLDVILLDAPSESEEAASAGVRVRVPVDEGALPIAPPQPEELVIIGELLAHIGAAFYVEDAPSEPVIVLPELPLSGPCVLATEGAFTVNVRRYPSTDADIMARLDPQHIYNVVARTADELWWQLANGWVAGWVTRRGGDCHAVTALVLQDVLPTVPPTVEPDQLVSAIVNLAHPGDQVFEGNIAAPQGPKQIELHYHPVDWQEIIITPAPPGIQQPAPPADRQPRAVLAPGEITAPALPSPVVPLRQLPVIPAIPGRLDVEIIPPAPVPTAMYYWTASRHLEISIACAGTGVEFVEVVLPDRRVVSCSQQGTTFTSPDNNPGAVAVRLAPHAVDAFVTWTITLSVVFPE